VFRHCGGNVRLHRRKIPVEVVSGVESRAEPHHFAAGGALCGMAIARIERRMQ
jgi:hypothetical protein